MEWFEAGEAFEATTEPGDAYAEANEADQAGLVEDVS